VTRGGAAAVDAAQTALVAAANTISPIERPAARPVRTILAIVLKMLYCKFLPHNGCQQKKVFREAQHF